MERILFVPQDEIDVARVGNVGSIRQCQLGQQSQELPREFLFCVLLQRWVGVFDLGPHRVVKADYANEVDVFCSRRNAITVAIVVLLLTFKGLVHRNGFINNFRRLRAEVTGLTADF